jgi:hypothetical protein
VTTAVGSAVATAVGATVGTSDALAVGVPLGPADRGEHDASNTAARINAFS